MKKFIKLTIFGYLCAGIIFLFGNTHWFPEFYNPEFMGWLSFLSALLIALPRFIFRAPDERMRDTVTQFQSVIAISLLTSAAGGLGLYQLYQYGFEYDKLAHFAVSFIFTIGTAQFLREWYGIHPAKSLIASAAIVMIGGFGWEILEFLADWYFNTRTLGQYGIDITKDTIIDVIMNTLGILAGMMYAVRKK